MSELKLEKLEKVLGKELTDKLRKAFNIETPPEAPKLFVKLADGTAEITGTIEVAQPVMMKAADGTEAPCPDGSYAIEGGKIITVMSGAITEISDVVNENPEMMSEAKVLELIQTSLSAQKAEFEAQIKSINDAHKLKEEADKKAFSSLVEGLEILAELKGEVAPPVNTDPRQKFAEKRQANFNRIGEIRNNILNKQTT